MKVKFLNYREAKGELERLLPDRKERLRKAIDKENRAILQASKTTSPRVPYRTGKLEKSGGIEPAKVDGSRVTGAVGFSDWKAIPVHEAGGPKFKRPGAGRQFLADQVDEERITKAVRKALLGK